MKIASLFIYIIFALFIYSHNLQSQTNRCFTYDASGNRILRVGTCASAIVVKDEDQLPDALKEMTDFTNHLSMSDNSVEVQTTFDLKVYPVPTSSKIYLLIKGYTDDAKWTLYNAIGHIILNGRNNLREIDLSSYPTGSYFFKIEEDDHVSIKQVLLLND